MTRLHYEVAEIVPCPHREGERAYRIMSGPYVGEVYCATSRDSRMLRDGTIVAVKFCPADQFAFPDPERADRKVASSAETDS